jgi:hypothetical protein
MPKHIELQFRGGLDHETLNGNIGNFYMILAAAVELPKIDRNITKLSKKRFDPSKLPFLPLS